MSKVEKSEELREAIGDQQPQEEEEVMDEETTKKLRNLTLDDAFFSSAKGSNEQKKNQNKKGDKKKNKRGEDFMDYAKNNGIDVKIQYEETSQDSRDNRNFNKDYKNNTYNKNKETQDQEQGLFYKKGDERNFKAGQRNFNSYNNHTQEENKTEGENNIQGHRGYQNNFNRKDRDFNLNNNYENTQNFNNYEQNGNYSHQGRQNYGNKNYHQKRNFNNNNNYNNNYHRNNYNQNQMYQQNPMGNRTTVSNKFDNGKQSQQYNSQKQNMNPYMMNTQGMNMYNNPNSQMMDPSQMPQMMSPQAMYMYQQQMMEAYKKQMMLYAQAMQQYGMTQDGEGNGPTSQAQPQQTVLETIEYYLSEDNLNKDYYIRFKLNSDGFLDASEIIRFNKMKAQGVTLEHIEEILKNSYSKIIEFKKDSEGNLLLRNTDWDSFRNSLTPIETLQQQRVLSKKSQLPMSQQMGQANMGNYYAMYMQNLQMQQGVGDGTMAQMPHMNPMQMGQMPGYGMMGYMNMPGMQMGHPDHENGNQ